MSDIICTHCGAPLEADNIDRRLAVARCNHCNGLTDISASPLMYAGRAEVPLPPGTSIDTVDGALRIVHRWFTWKKLGYLAVSLVAPFVFYQFYKQGKFPIDGLFLYLLGLIFIAGFYGSVAAVINRTSVTVRDQVIRVRHWPLLWLPMPTLKASEIDQIYCRRREVETSNSNDNQTKIRIVYDVVAVLESGRNKSLVRSMDNQEAARFLEQEIENELGIQDRAVGTESV